MKHALFAAGFAIFVAIVHAAPPASAPFAAERQQAEKLQKDGNFKEALAVHRKLLLDPANRGDLAANDVERAHECLQRLGTLNELDALLEQAVTAHSNDWRVLQGVANTYASAQHYGFMVSGQFERGSHRGGGKHVYSGERDRGRALQLLDQARAVVARESDKYSAGRFYMDYAQFLAMGRGQQEAWRLQVLTDIPSLPDYEDNYAYSRDVGTPVDADGSPLLYAVPKSWETARNDGERWRWLLTQAMEMDPSRTGEAMDRLARFLWQQFGEQTLVERYGDFFRGQAQDDDGRKDTSGTFELHTLGDNDAITRLANGVRRHTLPAEYSFIRIFKQIAADKLTEGYAESALQALAEIHENRRQYDKAAAFWQESIRRFGPGHQNWKRARQDQIVANWARFDGTMAQPAGKNAAVGFVFRNGSKAAFTARAVKVPELLRDIKAYIKSDPRRMEWERVQLGDIGWRLVQQGQDQYLGEVAAEWDLVLEPRAGHWDRRIDVVTPLAKPGAYLLTAKMQDGNTCSVIVWLSDTVIVRKPLDNGAYYFVADAASGAPVPKVNVEFFGWRADWDGKRQQVKTTQFAEFTDPDGQVVLDATKMPPDNQWLAVASDAAGGRFAYLGFSSVWYQPRHDAEYKETKVFSITDRPVYRPAQKVLFKFWIGHAQYDREGASPFAGRKFRVTINNPKGDKVLEQEYAADAFGGIDGELELPKDAALGAYGMSVIDPRYVDPDSGKALGERHLGGGNFRVEEYKKPEFEVTVQAPDKPVMLGEKIAATIQAKYYFGAPVTEAKVKYKVLRYTHDTQWYPPRPWDWFYGPGYWWFACDYAWYPGWREWGCPRPWPWWWPRDMTPPEVVSENEVRIGSDGKVKVEIDTAFAKAVHGDIDHRYEITAEVTDASRRTIVGKGSAVVARKPFKVYVWTDRGHYRTGDPIEVRAGARTADQKPVKGEAKLTLYRVRYDRDGKPEEKAVQTWKLATDDEGNARQQIMASEAGQYRLACAVTDGEKHTIEGAYVLVIRGERADTREYRFNPLELVCDKPEYQPGERMELMVNTEKKGGTVLFFARPANGVYLRPKVLRLAGKSTVENLDIGRKDMPNFFVEAVTVADGRVYTETREVAVPPEKRVLNVDVLPSAGKYRPGQSAKVRVKLTDFLGKPFVGSTVVTVYDKALEYISGGSNVADIKEFFWKWRRHHSVNGENSVSLSFANWDALKRPGMGFIGVFGASLADEGELLDSGGGKGRNREARRGAPGGGGGFLGGLQRKAAFSLAAAAAPMSAVMEADGAANGMVAMDAVMVGEDKADAASAGPQSEGSGGAEVTPVVRTRFADLVHWTAALQTDTQGLAEVAFDMPENLTTWKVKTWAMGDGTRVGEGATEVITSKDLIIRLQAPRFFVEKDEVVLSAVVHNYLDKDKEARVALELGGQTLEPDGKTPLSQKVRIKAGGEQRVDWRVKALKEGEAVITMKALTDEESDAMQMTFPVHVHGMLKMESYSGAIRPEGEKGLIEVTVPAERRPEQTRLEVRYSPTLAGALVDALPYLVEYPYGCTEQTLNRFLPTVMVQKILRELGVDLKAVREKRTNLNAQEIGDPAKRAAQWQRWERNPVFEEDTVRDMVQEGLKRLYDMQCSDGGWGWFSGWGEHSYAHTTACVVHGLQTAVENDVALVPGVLERGVEWLKRYQAEQVRLLQNAPKKREPWKTRADDLDALVFMVLVDADALSAEMRDFLYRDRTDLSVYAKAMTALAMHKIGRTEERDMLRRNVEQFLVKDDENQTAYLKLGNESYWWCWYGSEIEAHAYYLKLLNQLEPKGDTASRLVKYLLNNRKHATYWNSTRDTALAIEAMAEYLKASGEDKPDMTVRVLVDGQPRKDVRITPADLFVFDGTLVMEGVALDAGKHTIELRREGRGPLYYNAYLTNFTLEDFIKRAGLEVKVNRTIYRLDEVDKNIKVVGARGQAVDQKVEKYRRTALDSEAALKSGDLVEVELEIESKNDYEYLVFEDYKAAGFEPVDLRSGYTGNEMGAYVEFRDEKAAFFVRALARGKHSVTYRLRAEIPGRFSALPARGYAMYAPELKGNSDEIKLRVED